MYLQHPSSYVQLHQLQLIGQEQAPHILYNQFEDVGQQQLLLFQQQQLLQHSPLIHVETPQLIQQ